MVFTDLIGLLGCMKQQYRLRLSRPVHTDRKLGTPDRNSFWSNYIMDSAGHPPEQQDWAMRRKFQRYTSFASHKSIVRDIISAEYTCDANSSSRYRRCYRRLLAIPDRMRPNVLQPQ